MYPEGQDILVVHNDPARRALIERILRQEGFQVTAASEGFGALRAAGAQRFALIVAAVELPGSLDGMTTVRQTMIEWSSAGPNDDIGRQLRDSLRR